MRRRPSRRAFLLAPIHPMSRLREMAPLYWPVLIWGVTALLATLLGLRFGMRLLGVRQDIPFPSIIYGITAPLVQPFYSMLPANERYDAPAVEVASLAAIGVVLTVALIVYTVGRLFVHLTRNR